MQAFAYAAPETVEQAVAMLTEHAQSGRRAQLLAGGTDLLVQLRSIDRDARTIIDVKKLPEANRLEVGPDEIFIGSAVPAAVLTANAELGARLPGLVESVDLIGSTQIQGRATLGGNLCNASPAGDTIPALIANAGRCRIAGPGGPRELPVEDFVTGVGTNALLEGELLLGLVFDTPALGTADAYLRFIPRTEMDIAVAGAGVSVTLGADGVCTAARVGIGAVAPTALLVPEAAQALVGTRLEEEALSTAGAACSAASKPISDKRGTADYRRKVVAVLCRRAAAIAAQRAQENLR